jgi:hypothetical protein
MNHHPDAPRIKLTESTDAKNGRLSDPRTKQTKEPHTMNQTITIERRDQYGATVYRPVCEAAQAFADIAKTKTLTAQALTQIKKLGYQINITQPATTF